MIERKLEQYAWLAFLAIGILVLVGAIPHALGFNTDPGLVQNISGKAIDELEMSNPMFFNLYSFYFRGGGLSDLGVAFFLIVISATAYRRAERWAWYAFWFVPAYFLSWVVLSFTLPPESKSTLLPPLIVIISLSLLGLFLPFKVFFSNKK